MRYSGGLDDLDEFDVEDEILAGERMVGIHRHLVLVEAGNHERDRTLRRPRLQLHARLEVDLGRDLAARDLLY